MSLSKKEIYDKIAKKEMSVEEGMRLLKGGEGGEDSSPKLEDAQEPIIEDKSKDISKSVINYIKMKMKSFISKSPDKISINKNFMELGVESINLIEISKQIEKEIGIELYPTLFFEYQNVKELADYFLSEYLEPFDIYFKKSMSEKNIKKERPIVKQETQKQTDTHKHKTSTQAIIIPKKKNSEIIDSDIAIIGMAGRFAESENLNEFWTNLENGEDLITEVPESRWNVKEWFDPDRNAPNKTYSKWGSFIKDIDKFDPGFFGIAPKEAVWMDPQLRLLLEVMHETTDDAGYSKTIRGSNTGLFLGVMYHQYWDEIVRAGIHFTDYQYSSSVMSSLTGRICYTFDLHGAGIPLDNACASSLTALHLACQALQLGEIEKAFVAGINLLISPLQYVYLSRMQALSPAGHCYAFDKRANGYVPGEGIAALLLKPLKDAIHHNDNIHAIIKGSAINHVGKSNNPTSPRPELQTKVILDAWKNARIKPETISYLEAHGTGTELGDPIEITALKKAFGKYTSEKTFCYIGSTKAHIGHTEGAAGLASILKVILAMKNKKIPAMPAFNEINPFIKINDSPFIINKELIEWKTSGSKPRLAGISSFGMMGNNAHVVVEEYIADKIHEDKLIINIFMLSAKNKKGLKEYAKKFINFMETTKVDLNDILYSLQTGREYLHNRLAIVCKNKDDLLSKLRLYIMDKDDIEIVSGVSEDKDDDSSIIISSQTNEIEIVEHWMNGEKIDWDKIYNGSKRKKVSLPTYPFERKRFWFKDFVKKEEIIPVASTMAQNNSSFVFYNTTWDEDVHIKSKNDTITGKLLLFDTTDGLYNELLNKSIIDKNNILLIKSGDKFSKDDANIYTINPTDIVNYKNLLRDLISLHFDSINILFNWTGYGEKYFNTNKIPSDLSHSIYPLYYIITLFNDVNFHIKKILFFYRGEMEISNPIFDSVNGFSRSIEQVLPGTEFRTIKYSEDIQNKVNFINIILAEMNDNHHRDKEIYYDGEKRNVKKVQILSLETNEQILIKEKGVYLITGGLGALGRIFTRYLLGNFQARIVLLGRSHLDDKKKKIIDELLLSGGEITYLQADVSNENDMAKVFHSIKKKYNVLNGIIHTAGSITSKSILECDFNSFNSSLSAKIHGTVVLDKIFMQEDLDFYILFSSVSSLLGDLGQCSYAIGNTFQDSFSRYREELVKKGERKGRTIAINWPLWREGGMHFDREAEQLYLQSTGMEYMEEKDGIHCFNDMLKNNFSNIGVFVGNETKIKQFLGIEPKKNPKIVNKQTTESKATHIEFSQDIAKNCEKDLIQLSAELLMSDESDINPNGNLGDFGFDSLTLKDFSIHISNKYNIKVTPAVFFAQSSIAALSKHLADTFPDQLAGYYNSQILHAEELIEEKSAMVQDQANNGKIEYIEKQSKKKEVAIIGINGIFPQSKDLNEFWKHLENQDSLITEVPPERWDWRKYFGDPLRGENKTLSKWGGFIDDVDKFDPLFFNISPSEAEVMDPQHRLFLEVVWKTFEDAGYKISDFSGMNVGVFVGAQFTDYSDLLKKYDIITPRTGTGNAHSILANRISFLFNFHGPSEAIDTACSSGLVAFHRAVKSIQYGESELAIAGGVSLMITPDALIGASKMGIISPDGKCKTFDKSANGYVKGEGVGAFLLKPLQKATDDHDYIYAVVKGTAVNHGGTAHSLTAPNSEAQASLIVSACEDGDVDPETITYIECHGTGTELGDPVEIEGLKKAFNQLAKHRNKEITKQKYCGLGSVKTNVGHLEPAAGAVGLLKVVLAMQNQRIPGLVNFKTRNPYLEIEGSPFYIVEKTKEWEKLKDLKGNKIPRRAGVSSFGFGGTNAHIIVEEAPEINVIQKSGKEEKYIVPLSAKSIVILKKYIKELKAYLKESKETILLENFSYTLQVGREAFNERVIFIVDSIEEFIKLSDVFLQGKVIKDKLFAGNIKKQNKLDIRKNQIMEYIDTRNYFKISELWIAGEDIEWQMLYKKQPYKISLPAYSFNKKRYWINIEQENGQKLKGRQRLHPLVLNNVSTLKEQKFNTILTDKDFFVKDHIVSGQMVFPGVAYLEMARVAADFAIDSKITGLSNIVWSQPVIVDNSKEIFINLYPGKNIQFQVYSLTDNNRIRHCQGIVDIIKNDNSKQITNIDIDKIKDRCINNASSEVCYKYFARQGLVYGTGFRGINDLFYNDEEVLSTISIPKLLSGTKKDYILHPTMMDAALQSVIGFFISSKSNDDFPNIPFSIKSIGIIKEITDLCYAYTTLPTGSFNSDSEVNKFDILILDPQGYVLVDIKEFVVRKYKRQKPTHYKKDNILMEMNKLIDKVIANELLPLEAVQKLEEIYG